MTGLTYRRWTDEKIIEELKALHGHGIQMSVKGIGAVDPPLLQSAIGHFGTLRKALKAAGVPWSKRRIWDEERVVAEIRRLHEENADLSASRIAYSNTGLHQAAIKHCGSWNRAMSLAGIAPKEYSRNLKGPKQRWTKENVIDRLKELNGQGVEMSVKGIGTADSKLYLAARKHFGDIGAALERAGLKLVDPPPRSRWTRDKVIAEIGRLSASGEDLSYGVMIHNHPELSRAARKYFGPWSEALKEVGIDPESVRKRHRRTDEELAAELRAHYDRGEPVNAGALRQNHSGLATMLWGRFGTHDAALRAAGLDPAEIRLK
jgi:hypothetical protein